MKNSIIFKIAVFLLVLVVAVECNNYGADPIEKDNKNDMGFCSCLNVENIEQTIPFVDEFLSGQSTDLTDAQKLDALTTWLKEQPCVIDASVLCRSCVETDPPTSEIVVSFEKDGRIKEFIFEVSMGNPLKVVGYREYGNSLTLSDFLYADKIGTDTSLLIGEWDIVEFAHIASDNKISNVESLSRGRLVIPFAHTPIEHDTSNRWMLRYLNSYWFICSLNGNLIELKLCGSSYGGVLPEERKMFHALINAYSFAIRGDHLFFYFIGEGLEGEVYRKYNNCNLLILKKR